MRRLAAVLVLCMTSFGVSEAQRAEPVPTDLVGVGVEEHLEATLPLDLTFTNESGKEVVLRDYFGQDKPVLLMLAYYKCPMLCGLVLNGLIEALGEIDWVPGREFQIVTVSIDPRETPKLAAYKKQNVLESYGRPAAREGWQFLTGREENIRPLADALGFGYEYLEEREEYAHPAVLFVSTPEGKISRYLYGVKYDPRTLRLSLVEASEGKVGSTVDRFLLYCYHYDPNSGRYAPVAMNIMRVGAVLTLSVLGVVLAVFWRIEILRRRARSSTREAGDNELGKAGV